MKTAEIRRTQIPYQVHHRTPLLYLHGGGGNHPYRNINQIGPLRWVASNNHLSQARAIISTPEKAPKINHAKLPNRKRSPVFLNTPGIHLKPRSGPDAEGNSSKILYIAPIIDRPAKLTPSAKQANGSAKILCIWPCLDARIVANY